MEEEQKIKKRKKKESEDPLLEIKKNLKAKNIIIGSERTIKNLKLGRIKKVFLSSNCPENVKKDIRYYSKISKFEIIELNKRNDELGDILKKPFLISVLSIAK